MLFEANRGQGPGGFEFLSRGVGYTIAFGRDKVSIDTGKNNVTMRILSASPLLRIEGEDPQQAGTNYFIGNDPSKWITAVKNYSRVRYRGVYPGIDLVFYGNGKQLEYDWVIGPGADPRLIRTKFDGVRGVHVEKSGDLLLKLKHDEIRWRKPLSYQGEEAAKRPVKAVFTLNGRREVGFAIGDYDSKQPLVIDPILSYATYIGGSGDEFLFSLAVDGQGNSYITGGTSSQNFPLKAAYQSAFKSSGSAGFITKINPDGTSLVYSTFIGGTGNNNAGTGITVDSSGFAYVTGGTTSTDFPTVNPIQSTNHGGADLYISKLSQDGSALLFSTYLGGTGDEISQGIALDSGNNIYITGWTKSSTSFPTVHPIRNFGGGTLDGFVTKINSTGSSVVYSTYVGGSGDDNSFGISVDPLNQAYISGQTNSSDFPVKNAAQSTYHGGGNDVFVTAVNAAGTDFIYSTYLGGDDQDRSRAIYVDSQSNAYVTGDTQSPVHSNGIPFPTTSNAYQKRRAECASGTCVGGSADVFLTKLNATGTMVYSTYFGGAVGYDCGPTPTQGCGADKGLGVTIDPMGDIFIGGTTNSTDFPTASPTQLHNAGGYDAFVIKFSADGQKLLFSTYFGGSGTDYAYNLARTQQGAVYVSGWASNSFNFPHSGTPPLFAYGGGNYDGFVMKLSNADVQVISHGFQALLHKAPSHGTLQPSAVSGGNYSYTMDMQNTVSSEDGDNGYLTIGVSGPTTIDSCNSTIGTCNAATNPVTVSNIPTFAHGATIHVTLNGHVNTSANPGDQVSFQLYGQSDTNDPNPTNNFTSDGFTVQSSCSMFVSSGSTSFAANGGMGNFSVSSPCGFGWSTSNPAAWLNFPVSGGPGGPFSFSVIPNPTSFKRSATVSISGQPLTITQSGARLTLILYDRNSGQEYTAQTNNNGAYSYTPNLFTSSFDTLRTGDFNGDGKTDLVLYNSQNALAYILFGDGNGGFAAQSLFWSPGYDTVESGDLNGDGMTDFALYNSATGTMYTGLSNGNGTFTYKYTLISKGYTAVRLADFTGDGKADIFLYNMASGNAYLGVGDGTGSFTFHALFISPGYNFVDWGDLTGDGKADLILYNSANGNAATGVSDGVGGFAFTPQLFSAGFTSVKLGDYTGDGKADVTLYNKNNAAAYFGTGTGSGGFNFQSLFWSPGYDSVLTQDANGDGKVDVILYNSATGTEYTGISNGNGTFAYTYTYWGIGRTLAR